MNKIPSDSKNAVTLLSPLAVAALPIHYQYINIKQVTDDSKNNIFRFFVTFGAGHVLKLITLLPSKVIPALLNICLLTALVLLTVPSDTPLFR